jgi:hypothetical protein
MSVKDAELAETGLICEQRWTDPEPDTLRIAVRRERLDDDTLGKAFVTFTCSDTWLKPGVVRREVLPWLENCIENAAHINGGGDIAVDPCLGHQILVGVDIEVEGVDLDDEDVLEEICRTGLDEWGLWGSTRSVTGLAVSVLVHEDVDRDLAVRLARSKVGAAVRAVQAVFPTASCTPSASVWMDPA